MSADGHAGRGSSAWIEPSFIVDIACTIARDKEHTPGIRLNGDNMVELRDSSL
jgi:hypothetical protein